MNISLRKNIYGAAILVALILSLLLSFGVRQYHLRGQYEKIIAQNEKLLFQFVTIREHITEVLLEGRFQQISTITSDIESLNANISQILQTTLIPEEYKLGFANQIDIAGIILMLKTLNGEHSEQEKIRQLTREVRILGERLMLFDRVIVKHVQRKLVGFQSVIIGTLAITVFIIINILLSAHHQIAAPLLRLISEVKEVTGGNRTNLSLTRKTGEIGELTVLLNKMINRQDKFAAEERNQRSETIKACQLASMGEVAVGVAHEISELSNSLINYAQIIADEIDESGRPLHPDLLHKIIWLGERIAHIVQQLLFFSQKQDQPLKTVQIEKVIDETLSLVRPQLKDDGIQVNTTFQDELPPVQINLQQMQHVFLNLLSNARYALNLRYPGPHEKKRLEIKGEIIINQGRQRLALHFTDWGTGIEPNHIPNIYTPFFSTKPPNEGTGLGLCISREFIRAHHGDIRIDSIPNQYTVITVELALSAAVIPADSLVKRSSRNLTHQPLPHPSNI